jgi:hypothetical protein
MKLQEVSFPMELNDFIQVYESNLNLDACNFLIQLIDAQESDSLNLTHNRDASEDIAYIHNEIVKLAIRAKVDYYEYVNSKVFPDNNAFEQIHIFKKKIEEDVVSVDVTDYESARRFLGFTWFLNNNSGGQIEFLGNFIQPVAGNLLVHPPQWMFPYKEHCTSKDFRYTMKTYLHYK